MLIYTKSMLAHITPYDPQPDTTKPVYFIVDPELPRPDQRELRLQVDSEEIPFISIRLARLRQTNPTAGKWYFQGDEKTARAHCYSLEQLLQRATVADLTVSQVEAEDATVKTWYEGKPYWDKALVDTQIKQAIKTGQTLKVGLT